MPTPIDRRDFLARVTPLTAAILAATIPTAAALNGRPKSPHRQLALVYRGPASSAGCPESVAALLRSSPSGLHTVFCGPGERVPLSARALSRATLYAQPGGGELTPAWQHLHQHADQIRNFVRHGGHYLGFCLGGYLAGRTPGFGLLPGDTDQYITTPRAGVHTTDDTMITVRWRGHTRHIFFQDGPYFSLHPGANANVLATYANGLPAAVLAPYGAGNVGVVGPHPEADQAWYSDSHLQAPDGLDYDLGYDLIEATLTRPFG